MSNKFKHNTNDDFNNQHKLDDLFREELSNHEIIPPRRVWTDMSDQLPLPIPFYQQPVFWLGSLAAALLLITGIYSYQQQTQKDLALVQQDKLMTIQQEQDIVKNTSGALNPDANYSKAINKGETTLQKQDYSVINNKEENLIPNQTETFASLTSNSEKLNVVVPSSVYNEQNSYKTSVYQKQLNGTADFVDENMPYTSSKQEPSFIAFTDNQKNNNPLNNPNTGKLSRDKFAVSPLPYLHTGMIGNGNGLDDDDKKARFKKGMADNRRLLMETNPQFLGFRSTGFHFGTFLSFNNTWVLNRSVLKAGAHKSLTYKMDFGTDYGFSAGYDFSPRIGMQVEWIINSAQGQQYNKIQNGEKTGEYTGISLTYSHIPVLMKYRFNKITANSLRPITISLVGGVQYGMLKTTEINIANSSLHNDLLKRSSWGYVLGLDYDMYFTRNYYFTFSARAAYSTSGDSFNDFNFPTGRGSNQLVTGLRAALNYRFNK